MGQDNLYGYNKKNGKLTINEKEAEFIRELFTLYAEDKYGFRVLTRILTEKGYRNQSGDELNPGSLKGILQITVNRKMSKQPSRIGFCTSRMIFRQSFPKNCGTRLMQFYPGVLRNFIMRAMVQMLDSPTAEKSPARNMEHTTIAKFEKTEKSQPKAGAAKNISQKGAKPVQRHTSTHET